jgi:hypothetical protein
VELLNWYEAIFGKEMWKHVVTETTFWKHSTAATNDRRDNRQMNDTLQELQWREKIHKDLGIPKEVNIPSVFIDPVVHIFVDPCNSKYTAPEEIEKDKFIEYTDK